MKPSRRRLIQFAVPAMAVAQTASSRKLNIVCVGGHPDDPESGCGGALALYAGAGHAVTVIYLTRGEGTGGAPLYSRGSLASTSRMNSCSAWRSAWSHFTTTKYRPR